MTHANGAEHCQLFARLEHLGEDLAPFEVHLGFALTPLARVNVSSRDRDYRRYYDDTLAEQVGRLAAADIGRFGYEFG